MPHGALWIGRRVRESDRPERAASSEPGALGSTESQREGSEKHRGTARDSGIFFSARKGELRAFSCSEKRTVAARALGRVSASAASDVDARPRSIAWRHPVGAPLFRAHRRTGKRGDAQRVPRARGDAWTRHPEDPRASQDARREHRAHAQGLEQQPQRQAQGDVPNERREFERGEEDPRRGKDGAVRRSDARAHARAHARNRDVAIVSSDERHDSPSTTATTPARLAASRSRPAPAPGPRAARCSRRRPRASRWTPARDPEAVQGARGFARPRTPGGASGPLGDDGPAAVLKTLQRDAGGVLAEARGAEEQRRLRERTGLEQGIKRHARRARTWRRRRRRSRRRCGRRTPPPETKTRGVTLWSPRR